VFDRQLSKSELHTVNYVAGFCIKDVVGVCNVCDEFVRIAPCETANLESHKFTANMEFKANKRSLLYATAPVVQLLKNAENYFKFVKGKVTDDVKRHLVHNMLQYGCDIVKRFPSCHNVASKLLTKYFTTRLHALATKL
jgi:hypothetical protein